MTISVLVVDDDQDTAELVRDVLRRHGYDSSAVTSAAECLASLRARPRDLVVTDINMSGTSGTELCRLLAKEFPEVAPIVLTGEGGLAPAIEALQAGAYDYLTKPVKTDVLLVAVARAAEHVGLSREVRRLRDSTQVVSEGIPGRSEGIAVVNELIARVADSDATVLITGESGTGKELVARALHQRSSRRGHPFIAVNCAAMPAPLLESELFGHTRGAFTDAHAARTGLFVQAGAGTVFLDEIGEMPIEMQVKLLRVLQERKVRPVGGDNEVPVKARIITATNRHLEREVAEKRFREDLYYRINVVAIPVPPLRARANDVMELAQRFLVRGAARIGKPVRGFSTGAAKRMMAYDWPGNVRELENCVERAVALCALDEITVADLPPKVANETPHAADTPSLMPDELITIDEMERRYVRQVLAATNNNKTHAARVLGIDRRSLYRRLEGPAPAEGEPEEP